MILVSFVEIGVVLCAANTTEYFIVSYGLVVLCAGNTTEYFIILYGLVRFCVILVILCGLGSSVCSQYDGALRSFVWIGAVLLDSC